MYKYKKTIKYIIIFVCALPLILLVFFSDIFSFFNKINYSKDINKIAELQNLDKSKNINFFGKFKLISLPLYIQSNKINFSKWEDITLENTTKFSFVTNLDKVENFSDIFFTSSQPEEIFKDKVELKTPKYYLAFVENNFIGLIHLHKIYNDQFQNKTTYIILTTITKQGEPINSLKIGEATFNGNYFLEMFQPKTITRVKMTKDYKIYLQEKRTYRPYDGTTLTTIWKDAANYVIESDGKIVKIDTATKIKRDE